MKICAKEARRLKLKIDFGEPLEVEEQETVLNFLVQYEVYGFEENVKSCQILLS